MFLFKELPVLIASTDLGKSTTSLDIKLPAMHMYVMSYWTSPKLLQLAKIDADTDY